MYGLSHKFLYSYFYMVWSDKFIFLFHIWTKWTSKDNVLKFSAVLFDVLVMTNAKGLSKFSSRPKIPVTSRGRFPVVTPIYQLEFKKTVEFDFNWSRYCHGTSSRHGGVPWLHKIRVLDRGVHESLHCAEANLFPWGERVHDAERFPWATTQCCQWSFLSNHFGPPRGSLWWSLRSYTRKFWT